MTCIVSRLGGINIEILIYNASQKHESTILHTYVVNEFLTAYPIQQSIFEKTLIEACSSHL